VNEEYIVVTAMISLELFYDIQSCIFASSFNSSAIIIQNLCEPASLIKTRRSSNSSFRHF